MTEGQAPVAGAGGVAVAAPGGEEEAEYQRVLARLKAPAAGKVGPGLLLVGSLAAFLLAQGGEGGLRQLGVLTAVLLVHEGGHWLAMRALGWRDVRMFFIPFFGAAVSGRRLAAEPWKEGVVTLAGPLPGLVAGAVVGLVLAVSQGAAPLARETALMLLSLNLFNLLPLSALDGGRLLQLTLFQRRAWLEQAFLGLAGLGTVAAAVALSAPVLGVVGAVALLGLPWRRRVGRAARALQAAGVALPADPRELDGEAGRAAFRSAVGVFEGHKRTDAAVASMMEQLGDLASRRPPGLLGTLALLGAWAGGLVLGLVGLAILGLGAGPRWRVVEDPGHRFHLAVPQKARFGPGSAPGPHPSYTVLAAAREATGLVVLDFDEALPLQPWQEAVEAALAPGYPTAVKVEPGPGRGSPCFELERASEAGRVRVVGCVHRGHGILVQAWGPRGDATPDLVVSSLALRP